MEGNKKLGCGWMVPIANEKILTGVGMNVLDQLCWKSYLYQ